MTVHPVPLHRWTLLLSAALILLFAHACITELPSMGVQRAKIKANIIEPHKLSSEAFLQVWGTPTYDHSARTQFFVLNSGAYIPTFRVPLGEHPPDWDFVAPLSQDAYFFAYADRNELLGFVDESLVYRERMDPEELTKMIEQWKKEDSTKSRIERQQRRLDR